MGLEDDRERWDARHRRASGRALESPSAWLTEHRDLLDAQPRGRALDVACGRGRNALFLAQLGFDVDAVDVSGVAIEIVRGHAAARGVVVQPIRADLRTAALPRPPYEVIVDLDYLERPLLPRLADALAPGGLLLMETFTREHPTMNPAFALAPDELPQAFDRLRVLRYRDSGPRAGIVARRP